MSLFLSALSVIKSVTCGFPIVRVPVLSSITVLTFAPASKTSADFTSIPSSAALPVPTIIAVGVASPKAHGQEITSTDIPKFKAVSKLSVVTYQMIAVKSAIVMTAGTKILLILSASFAILGFVSVASSTSLIIPESTVS